MGSSGKKTRHLKSQELTAQEKANRGSKGKKGQLKKMETALRAVSGGHTRPKNQKNSKKRGLWTKRRKKDGK